MGFLGQNSGRGGVMLTSQRTRFYVRGFYVSANFGKNLSRNATVRVSKDGQIHRYTDANRFYICPMLYAIAMEQIIISRPAWSREDEERKKGNEEKQ